MNIHGVEVKGLLVDEETRCEHYHTDKDIIAIKFPCCDTYYPCYECHDAVADHPALVWRRDQFHERAIFCGACGHELTIAEYLACDYECPACQSKFNPRCENHYPWYFETKSSRQ
jgi:uncharacterized CHY-type Zn-finger protein